MSKLLDNINELRKILGEKAFLQDVAIEFLDAIENDITEVVSYSQRELRSLESRIDDLNEELADKEEELKNYEWKAVAEGFFLVKIETLEQKQALESFVKTRIYPHCNQWASNLIF